MRSRVPFDHHSGKGAADYRRFMEQAADLDRHLLRALMNTHNALAHHPRDREGDYLRFTIHFRGAAG